MRFMAKLRVVRETVLANPFERLPSFPGCADDADPLGCAGDDLMTEHALLESGDSRSAANLRRSMAEFAFESKLSGLGPGVSVMRKYEFVLRQRIYGFENLWTADRRPPAEDAENDQECD